MFNFLYSNLTFEVHMKIFPKETDFFAIFEKAAANVTHAATLLVGIMEHFTTWMPGQEKYMNWSRKGTFYP